MSLAKTLNKGKQKTKIHINDIRENPDNYYEFMKKQAQTESITLYYLVQKDIEL